MFDYLSFLIQDNYKYKCAGCLKNCADIVKHLATIRKANSPCKKNLFSERLSTGLFGPIVSLAAWQASNS
jgi:hypothetical protein